MWIVTARSIVAREAVGWKCLFPNKCSSRKEVQELKHVLESQNFSSGARPTSDLQNSSICIRIGLKS